MQYWMRFLIVTWLTLGSAFGFDFSRSAPALPVIAASALPYEAQQTLALIKLGGPFPYARDGITFGNFEKRLPLRPRGYYTEYTVKTPGRKDRGPRRIVAGERSEYYYTDDHYQSFRRIQE